MGILKKGRCTPALVFKGKLISARKHYQSANVRSKVALLAQLRQYKEFIQSMCKALTFLHIKKLVHVEISLDSVMVSIQCIR